MELFETAGNTMPPGAVVSGARTRDGVRLRVARWPLVAPRGTVAIATGRSEFIEEYYEVVAAIQARGFETVIWDWRGQGQSDREIRADRRGHVSRFSAYRSDLVAIEAQVLRPFAPRPWYGLGHSMGAAILIDQAHDGTSPFDRLVLSAPMIDIPLRWKAPIRALIRALDLMGFGSKLIPGGSEVSPFLTRGFENNVLTRDPRQHQRLATAVAQLPKLAVGAPTIRWLDSAFDLMARFADPFYAVETVVPTLVVAAGADRIVDTAATERFAIRLKAGQCVTLPGARHQIIMETAATVAQFWAAFDAFIPGASTAEPDPVPPANPAPPSRRLPHTRGSGIFGATLGTQ